MGKKGFVLIVLFIIFITPLIFAQSGPGIYILSKASLKDKLKCMIELNECIDSEYGLLAIQNKVITYTGGVSQTITLKENKYGKNIDRSYFSKIFFSQFDENDFLGFCAEVEFKADSKCLNYDETVIVTNINDDFNNIEFKKDLIKSGEKRLICKIYKGTDLINKYGSEIKYKNAYVYSLCPQTDKNKLMAGIDKETVKQELNWPNDTYFLFSEKNFIQATHNKINYLEGNNNINIIGASLIDIFGSSMQPTAFSGNKLIYRPLYNKNELKEGMIVGYYNFYDKLTFHRIRAKYPMYDTILVQGDNLGTFEEISTSQIAYIVIGVLYT